MEKLYYFLNALLLLSAIDICNYYTCTYIYCFIHKDLNKIVLNDTEIIDIYAIGIVVNHTDILSFYYVDLLFFNCLIQPRKITVPFPE